MPELLIATLNAGKFREIEAFLKMHHPQLTLLFLRDLDPGWSVEEDGKTFLENARKKAVAAARQFRKNALADDTGLLVDALDGKPGVHSSRYAGSGASDTEKAGKLLQQMKEVPFEKRTARFECTMVLAHPNGDTLHETGTLEGLILEAPRGNNGFGYDPVFFVPSLGKTLAELETAEKNRTSHRAQALQKISSRITS